MKHLLHYGIFLLLINLSNSVTGQVTKLSNNTNLKIGIPLNGKFLMVDKDGALWSTDGTAVNTLKYTTKATYDSTGSIAIINNKLYFSGTSTASGTELWVTDGTDAGTSIVKDINSGAGNSSPKSFNVINNVLYFSADDGSHGRELWTSDGTGGGTSMVKDINPGSAGGLDSASFFVNNNMLFFTPNDGTHGTELWISDGTSGGTKLLKDIVAGSGEPAFGSFAALGTNTVFEVAIGGLLFGNGELWISDGTAGGTKMLKDFGTFSGILTFGYLKFNDKLYFDGTNATSTGTELWVTDGTVTGTSMVKDINPGVQGSEPLLFNGVLFPGNFLFTANTTTSGYELWISDGTDAGTKLFDDINPGAPSSNPFIFSNFSSQGLVTTTLYNGKIFFGANDGTHGNELWITDGTKPNTNMVKDILPGTLGSLDSLSSYFYTSAGLYFGAADGTHGVELWKSDGTSGGTTMVKDINAGSQSSSPRLMGIFNNHLYFNADDGDNASGDRDLYIVDATTTTLPITLVNFTALPVKDDVDVNWTTSTEINTSFFNVQRSTDGRQFENEGTVQAAGNSSITRQYSFVDLNALHTSTPILYYRLQTNDKDGKQYYSPIVPVKISGGTPGMAVYPNPATDFIQLNFNMQGSKEATLRVTDASGKVVLSKSLTNLQNNNQTTLSVQTLPSGVYYVQLVTDKGTQSAKFIKQP